MIHSIEIPMGSIMDNSLLKAVNLDQFGWLAGVMKLSDHIVSTRFNRTGTGTIIEFDSDEELTFFILRYSC